MKLNFIFLILAFVLLFEGSSQHGSLVEPPSRNYAWKVDKDFKECCLNYDYNELNCGGTQNQWFKNGGKCGVCGEDFEKPQLYTKGGDKYLGKIMRTYSAGSEIEVEVHLTANHKGVFEFRICNLDTIDGDVTQECLNNTILTIANTTDTIYVLKDNKVMKHKYKIQLPEKLVCKHCVLQWKWIGAKDWGTDENGRGCMGCGIIQENSYNCADISITGSVTNTIVLTKKTTEPIRKPETKPVSEPVTEQTTKSSTVRVTEPKTKSSTERITESVVDIVTEVKAKTESTAHPDMTTESIIDQDWLADFKLRDKCLTKLNFGVKFNFKKMMTMYCEHFCHNKCPGLMKMLDENLKNSVFTEPTSDLLACLDTCPLICTCGNQK